MPDFSDFSTFLTAEDKFSMEFDDYLKDFIKHLLTNTLSDDQEFVDRTLKMKALGEEAGIDLQERINECLREAGMVE